MAAGRAVRLAGGGGDVPLLLALRLLAFRPPCFATAPTGTPSPGTGPRLPPPKRCILSCTLSCRTLSSAPCIGPSGCPGVVAAEGGRPCGTNWARAPISPGACPGTGWGAAPIGSSCGVACWGVACAPAIARSASAAAAAAAGVGIIAGADAGRASTPTVS